MRQFVGSASQRATDERAGERGHRIARDPTVRDLLSRSHRPECGLLRRVWSRRARDDGARRRAAPRCAYAQALADWADAGGYEAEVLWDACTVAALGVPVRPLPLARGAHALRRRAEAGRARGPAARAGRGAAARRAGQLPRRARPSAGSRSAWASRPRRCCSSATTASCWPVRRPGRHRRAGRGGNTAWIARRRLRVVPRGAARAVRPAGGAAPALGRGARQAQGAGA